MNSRHKIYREIFCIRRKKLMFGLKDENGKPFQMDWELSDVGELLVMVVVIAGIYSIPAIIGMLV